MFTFNCLVVFVTVIGSIHSSKLPPYITKCDQKDPQISECIRKEIVNAMPHFTRGVPELGVPSLDPVHLDDINIDGSGLKLLFSKPKMYGIKNGALSKLRVDIGNQEEDFMLGFKADLSLTAKYKIDGRILILPIQGQGDATVNATNVNVLITSKLAHVKAADGTHFKLLSPNYEYTIEKTVFDLQNLFNGNNKQLADTTLQFANENWRQLMDDLAPPAIKQIVKTCVKSINKFFSAIPIKDMLINSSD